MVYGIYNELVTGTYKPTNITGGPHIVGKYTSTMVRIDGETWRNQPTRFATRLPGVYMKYVAERET